MSEITIYHGSEFEIVKPSKEKGKQFNDYGKGFYCSKYKDSAAQWACKFQEDGIVNEYIIDTENLEILYLNEDYHILNWLAILVENREITGDSALRNKEFIIKNYMIDYQSYDIIIGYRADDAYFKYVREFLTNQNGVNTLDEAMYLGKLGLQVFIQSDKAFSKIRFVNSYEVDQEEFYIKSVNNIKIANLKYNLLKEKNEQNDISLRQIKGGELNENSIPKIKIK